MVPMTLGDFVIAVLIFSVAMTVLILGYRQISTRRDIRRNPDPVDPQSVWSERQEIPIAERRLASKPKCTNCKEPIHLGNRRRSTRAGRYCATCDPRQIPPDVKWAPPPRAVAPMEGFSTEGLALPKAPVKFWGYCHGKMFTVDENGNLDPPDHPIKTEPAGLAIRVSPEPLTIMYNYTLHPSNGPSEDLGTVMQAPGGFPCGMCFQDVKLLREFRKGFFCLDCHPQAVAIYREEHSD